MEKFFTIGVYGTDEKIFFDSLVLAKVDLFCDIRQHRGIRGKTYAYVNSSYLQSRLQKLGIAYLHYKDLAPTKAIREAQRVADETASIRKRNREILGEAFVKAYENEILGKLDTEDFRKAVGDFERVCLFCVECLPTACHRSLAALELSKIYNIPVEHLTPCQQRES